MSLRIALVSLGSVARWPLPENHAWRICPDPHQMTTICCRRCGKLAHK